MFNWNGFTPSGAASATLPLQNASAAAGGLLQRLERSVLPEYFPAGLEGIMSIRATDPSAHLNRSRRNAFQPPPAPRFGAKTAVGNSTVEAVVKQYADAYWLGREQPGTPNRFGSMRVAAEIHLGRTTPDARALGRIFSAVAKFLNQMIAAKRECLRLYPGFEREVQEVTDDLIKRSITQMTNGVALTDAGVLLNYYLLPRIEAAREKIAAAKRTQEAAAAAIALQRQAESIADEQKENIRHFWTLENPGTGTGMQYALNGEIVFDTVEEMESNCPLGYYTISFPETLENPIERLTFVYDGGGIEDVYLRQASGPPRKVIFRGDSWIYADLESWRDQRSQEFMQANAHRHFNTRWNGDPTVVQERARASREGRDILG